MEVVSFSADLVLIQVLQVMTPYILAASEQYLGARHLHFGIEDGNGILLRSYGNVGHSSVSHDPEFITYVLTSLRTTLPTELNLHFSLAHSAY